MASTTARVVAVAVLLMQCCNVILAVRPLLDLAAGDGGGRQLGQGGEALVAQSLTGAGGGNCHSFITPEHPPCPPAP
ncbi:unnamed protein product [Urochloa humidicola]